MRKLLCLALVLLLSGLLARGVAAQAPAISAEQLGDAVAQAQPGDTLIVRGGVYQGQIVIDKPLTLIGEGWPVIDGGGQGTVVDLRAPDITLQGFVIRNSGASLDEENSGVAGNAARLTVAGNRFEDTLFGIYLQESPNSVVRDNEVHSKALDVPRRGDGIRIWSSYDTRVENNRVIQARDVVLWYSERITVRGNEVTGGRYGLHFMYCDDALITENRLLDNSVGVYMMYSRRLTLVNNTVAGNRGPSGYGVGLKDVDDARVLQNYFLDNRAGIYLDGSPREVDSTGQFVGNVLAYNTIGVEMLPSVRNNQFTDNSFVENEEQVAIAGGGALPAQNEWTVNGRGNYWSDYAGYDANHDGVGDIEYRSERLFESLMQREPNLRLFLYSPASNALDFAARALPLVKPKPKLVDAQPLTAPHQIESAPPLPQPSSAGWVWIALLLVALSLLIALAAPGWTGRRYAWPPSRPALTHSLES